MIPFPWPLSLTGVAVAAVVLPFLVGSRGCRLTDVPGETHRPLAEVVLPRGCTKRTNTVLARKKEEGWEPAVMGRKE